MANIVKDINTDNLDNWVALCPKFSVWTIRMNCNIINRILHTTRLDSLRYEMLKFEYGRKMKVLLAQKELGLQKRKVLSEQCVTGHIWTRGH